MHPTHRLICAQVGAPRAALNDALGGRRVALGADIDAYRRIVSGDCTADEGETLFGLLARLFANTPQRSEAQARTYVDASRDAVRERERDPGARFATKRDQLALGGHLHVVRLAEQRLLSSRPRAVPAASSRRTTSTCPAEAAYMSGVPPPVG